MEGSEDSRQRSKHPSSSPPPGSYVYPVRSLLSNVRPATSSEAKGSNSGEGTSQTQTTRTVDISAKVEDASVANAPAEVISLSTSLNRVNFRDYPADPEAASPQRSFTTAVPTHGKSLRANFPSVIQGPAGEPVMFERLKSDSSSDEDELPNKRHPVPFSSAAAEALANMHSDKHADGSSLSDTTSLAGIVRLGPSFPEFPTTGQRSWHSSSIPGPRMGSGTGTRSGSDLFDASSKSNAVSDDQGSLPDAMNNSSQVSIIGSDYDSDVFGEPVVTMRFEHIETGDGHHVVVGREGKLTRCEDEPIRTPGSVQGFGVLIVLEEDDETGNLEVRQVSENAGELLGLDPKYLFSLECFTETLPDHQADLLWDNVQFLSDPDIEQTGNMDQNPQVFLLSGWGAPGTAVVGGQAGSDSRRFWTAWCAAHRPPAKAPINYSRSGSGSTSDSSATQSPHIILEFELERDTFNPLYPPPKEEEKFSGGSTPSTAGSSSTLSGTDSTTSPSTLGNLSGRSSSTLTRVDKDADQSLATLRLGMTQPPGLEGDEHWLPSPADVFESTTSHSKPLAALERMRRINRASGPSMIRGERGGAAPRGRGARARKTQAGVGTMDVFAVLAQVNEQLGNATNLDMFLKVVVGVIKDLTQFHRVLVYQFDEQWNGQVAAELVDWNQTRDLYQGLHFPAGDIPAQARELYCINKVRLLYDRNQSTARLVCKSRADLDPPLDLTHSYLRAMSPIHIKYLANMGVRSSMSISIMAFDQLWGLVACHSYGDRGMRVSFPVRQMLRLLSDSISRNIERLSYAHRLHTRKLISTLPTDTHPTGYIISNAEDLLSLFDADYGVLVIGEGAKILGPGGHGQQILIVAEYLRLKRFRMMQVSQIVSTDFPDLHLPAGPEVLAGLLYVPLSSEGKDFIALLRKGQLRDVHWAGKPFKEGKEQDAILEPRKSFKVWSETIAGRCRAWTDEQMETAGVLALVYGKFIEVWRQKESALQTNQLTSLLLSNASHEVRTPLNHIINYLEMALNGPLDEETRDNLSLSHSASKSLLFTINDLLDLTRLESGNETSFNEPFDLSETIQEAIRLYAIEANRRNLTFELDVSDCPTVVVGDARKIRTVVANLTANAVKYTERGGITIECHKFEEPIGLRDSDNIAVEIIVRDTGCGISTTRLESIFREFEQVQDAAPQDRSFTSTGLGLAVVARIVEQLGGQLRVDSRIDEGSRFSFLIPFGLAEDHTDPSAFSSREGSQPQSLRQRKTSETGSKNSELDNLVEALSASHIKPESAKSSTSSGNHQQPGSFHVEGSRFPVRGVKMDEFDLDTSRQIPSSLPPSGSQTAAIKLSQKKSVPTDAPGIAAKLRALIVEDDHINKTILSKRLTVDGHKVLATTNGQECVELIQKDRAFDIILMDIQMPILNGFEATEKIRELENEQCPPELDNQDRESIRLNGRIPIFAVSASLAEKQRSEMMELGFDGWLLKPIDVKRLRILLSGIIDVDQRMQNLYRAGYSWEKGGWLTEPAGPP